MDFFEAQDEARKRSRWLVLWFLVAVLGVVVAIDLLIWAVLYGGEMREGVMSSMAFTSLATVGVIFAASAFKSLQLKAGGAVVARDLGGRRIDPHTADTEERRLMNVVEEMAIASGMPVPQVFMMDDEMAINAFAAGTEPSNAVIGVTRGCVQLLTRDELQGVIAHEFSHILNGDMRLNMKLIGLIFGLIVISIIGRGLFHLLRYQSLGNRRSNSKEGGGIVLALFLFGIGLMVIGGIGVFFSRLIQAAISRQREYLADASAVQFTRSPSGIAGALKKIGGKGSRINNAKAGEASHLFFSDGGLFSFGFATHPPLNVRIQAIEKNWDGKWKETRLPDVAEDHVSEKRERRSPLPFDLPMVAGFNEIEQMGYEERADVAKGRAIRESIDGRGHDAAHDRQEAQALVFGLLLAEDHVLQAGEVSFLRKNAGETATELALHWQSEARGLHSSRKIALIDMAMPALRSLSRPEYDRFLEITRWLIVSDAQVDLFEFMLQRVVERHLVSHFEGAGPERIRYTKISKLAQGANLLVSTMAGVGAESEEELKKSYAEAVKPWVEEGWWEQSLADATSLDEVGKALDQFDRSSPLVKRELLFACGRAAACDGVLENREAELIRAIADSIGCPVPPFVGDLKEA